MEEKLVKVLLDRYKEKGIDMYALLDDRLFIELPLQKKLDLIKKYASHISSGTSRTLSKKDITSLIFDAGFAGLSSGALAMMGANHASQFFKKGILPIGAITGAIALGAGVAAANTYFNNAKIVKNRNDILKKLDSTSANPSDENALNVLITRNYQVNPTRGMSIASDSAKNVGRSLHSIPHIITGLIEPVLAEKSLRYNIINNNDGYAADVNDDVYEKAMHDAAARSRSTAMDILNSMKRNILGR